MKRVLALLALGCGPGVSAPDSPGGTPDAGHPVSSFIDAAPYPDVLPDPGEYTVYAHGNKILYRINLQDHTLETVGPFNAPGNDTLTDLAVAPDGTIYVNSGTKLYTADPGDGHVTEVTSLGMCGGYVVALSFTSDGKLMSGDFDGNYCRIDIAGNTTTVTKVGTLGGGMALAGDIVAVADGTMYGTAYLPSDNSTDNNNILVELDPATGAVRRRIGPTGFPKIFGVSFALGKVFGFTHDDTGRVITIDPTTGRGTLFGTFLDPDTGMGISFAGAGVNPMVRPIQ